MGAYAIHNAHNQAIIHRDLKPSNILIDETTGDPRITDPRRSTINPQLTLSGHVLGSPSFLPPEQATGKRDKVGRHTDVYALGAILYYLLTGRPPFAAETPNEAESEVLI